MQNLILILNCGSSSLKFAVIDAISEKEHLAGLAECLSTKDANISYKANNKKTKTSLSANAKHFEAISFILGLLNNEFASLKDKLVAVGHRVVHGGEKFKKSCLITNQVIKDIQELASLAPLHNPANLIGIKAAQKAFSNLKQIAVFDTAFHQSMPEHAYLYALPFELYKNHGIRRYGFHGTSHKYVSEKCAKELDFDLKKSNIIVAHLGNGASICAIKNAKSIDTSMGMTPLEGLVMGTRSGDLDPAILNYMHTNLNLNLKEIDDILNKKSGILGLSEKTNDCRYIEDNYQTDPAAKRTMDIMCYRLAKYIGAYAVALGDLDALVFTGGIGENSAPIRKLTLEKLAILGFKVDKQKNNKARFGSSGVITCDKSKIVAMAINTNEELVIAKDSFALVDK